MNPLVSLTTNPTTSCNQDCHFSSKKGFFSSENCSQSKSNHNFQANLLQKTDETPSSPSDITGFFSNAKTKLSSQKEPDNVRVLSHHFSSNNAKNNESLDNLADAFSFQRLETQMEKVREAYHGFGKLKGSKVSDSSDFDFEKLHSTNDKESPKSQKQEDIKGLNLPFIGKFGQTIGEHTPKFEDNEMDRDYLSFSNDAQEISLSWLENFGLDSPREWRIKSVSSISFSEGPDECSDEPREILEALRVSFDREEAKEQSGRGQNLDRAVSFCEVPEDSGELIKGKDEIRNDQGCEEQKDKEMSTDFSMELQEIDLKPSKEAVVGENDMILAGIDLDE